jgi:tetratricopeptide (TPR) repeat protein
VSTPVDSTSHVAPQDHLRSETRAAEAPNGAERDARIEQLLLAGLDQYFANQYEQAINLWTRVLFLDRHHSRARAYIERARSAQAERLRESEAVLHQGIEAFHDGNVELARRLVSDAVERGASLDVAQGLLDRIERLGAAQAPTPAKGAGADRPEEDAETVETPASRAHRLQGWIAAALLAAAAVGVLGVGVWGVAIPEPSSWAIFNSASARGDMPVVMPMIPEALPLAGATEMFVARGRAHLARGRLRDALNELDRVPVGDPSRVEADRLRAEIQRQLLSVAAAEGAGSSPE